MGVLKAVRYAGSSCSMSSRSQGNDRTQMQSKRVCSRLCVVKICMSTRMGTTGCPMRSRFQRLKHRWGNNRENCRQSQAALSRGVQLSFPFF
jgi:hypothetical protein